MSNRLERPTANAVASRRRSSDIPMRDGALRARHERPSAATEDPPLATARSKPRLPQIAKRRALTHEDYRALGAFRHAMRKFLAFSESGAAAQAITPQQHQALLAIKAHVGADPISVSELAACLLIKTHSAVGLVARLVDRGLVERRPSDRDRRRIQLNLTRAGDRILEIISRKNLGKLKTTAPVFIELLNALEQLDLPAPAEGDEALE